jgi:hypothetical protein
MYTYSEDLFMIAFFTLMARDAPTMALVAGGGVTPAGGTVPATAMVTNPAAEAAGSVPISWHPGSVEKRVDCKRKMSTCNNIDV